MRFFYLSVCFLLISATVLAQCDDLCDPSVSGSFTMNEGQARLCAEQRAAYVEANPPSPNVTHCLVNLSNPGVWSAFCGTPGNYFSDQGTYVFGGCATCADTEGDLWSSFLPPPCTPLGGTELCIDGCAWENVSDYCGLQCGSGGVGLCIEGQFSSWSGTGELCGPPSADLGPCDLPDGSIDLNCVCDNNPDLCQFCQGEDCEPDFCEQNPAHPACIDDQCTDPSCPEFCTNRPWHPHCQEPPDFCQQYPYNPRCFDDESFCEQNPQHVLCIGGSFCEQNPTHPACLDPEDFCEQNPAHPTCLEPPDYCDLHPFAVQCIDPGDFCQDNPGHPFCQSEIDFCDEFPGHPWCVDDWCADPENFAHPFCLGGGFCEEFPDHLACLDVGGFCLEYPYSWWCMGNQPDGPGEQPCFGPGCDGEGGFAVGSRCDLGPPICDAPADPVGCALLRQQWEIGCRDVVDIGGLAQVAAYGEGLDSQADSEVAAALAAMTTEVEIGMLDQTGFLPASCPPPVGLTVLGAAVEIPLQGWCDLATTVRPLVLALGGLFALLLLGRAW